MTKSLLLAMAGAMVLLLASLQPVFAEEEMSLDVWYQQVGPILTKTYCTTMSSLFVTPFNVTTDECLSLVGQASTLCFQAHRVNMPKTMEGFAVGQKWGKVLGECIGGSYQILMHSRAKS